MFETPIITGLTKSNGYTKNKTHDFRTVREEKRKSGRFRPKEKTSILDLNGSVVSSQNLITNRNTDTVIELGGIGAGGLPPSYVDIYDEAQEKLKQLRKLHTEIQKLVTSKIKTQFGDHSELDAQIDKKNALATHLLQDCETHLSAIGKISPDDSSSQKSIRKNMERVLASQIQETAMLFRKQQKGLLEKLKEQDTGQVSELNVDTAEDEIEDDKDLQEMMIVEDLARERDGDINKLVDNINKLSQLFKEMNQVVLESGTIVDRIDYNIEKSVSNTVKAKKELKNARKAMESKCPKVCIGLLILADIIFIVLLILKYSK